MYPINELRSDSDTRLFDIIQDLEPYYVVLTKTLIVIISATTATTTSTLLESTDIVIQ